MKKITRKLLHLSLIKITVCFLYLYTKIVSQSFMDRWYKLPEVTKNG